MVAVLWIFENLTPVPLRNLAAHFIDLADIVFNPLTARIPNHRGK